MKTSQAPDVLIPRFRLLDIPRVRDDELSGSHVISDYRIEVLVMGKGCPVFNLMTIFGILFHCATG